ncbi:endoglucanase [Streptomyces sp. AJS327]|uniref:glycoside hydrolase family 6 protein n=1 Tax=Streptomyces sp. AJS327 TaxID=2545265 RepID=UPI0015DF3481|nr:glycoside hydrolase family 6 protein [Streptomyces sp. AJS327]MBA0049632.1 endoglucanase [Streptomyces sp. AJS327]
MYGTDDRRGGRRARARLAATGAVLSTAMLLAGCSSSGDDDDGEGDGGKEARQPASTQTPYWVDPKGSAAQQVDSYRDEDKSSQAELIERIARHPAGHWVDYEDPEGDTRRVTDAAEKADRSALLVLYNIPHRDCGQYSKGGAADGNAYRAWVDKVAKGIGDRKATVIVEPDSIPHLLDEGCTPQQFHEERYQLLNETVGKLKKLPGTTVYVDAGNPDWVRDPGGLVEPLNRAGIAQADGFALNVSNYQTTRSNTAYGRKVSQMVGNKPFVIDTSRNGNGPIEGAQDEESWCNPDGRALGESPTTKTGDKRVDAYLWIKRPGESDGECKGGPKAGKWWPKYALDLVRNAKG